MTENTEVSQTNSESSHTTSHGAVSGSIFHRLKSNWTLFVLLLFSVNFYWMLWGNATALAIGAVMIIALFADFFVMNRSVVSVLKRHWPMIVILLIISISMYIRLFGYFTADGGTRWPYLRNIDSYFFYRYIGEITENNGVLPVHDALSLAPYGIERGRSPYDLYYYGAAYSYGIFHALFPDTSLQNFLAWFPVLLASLTVIPAYFIGKTLYDRRAGLLTGVFMIFTVPFMSRSLGGDPDSDAIIMLVMISSIAAFLIAYKKLDTSKIFTKNNILYSVIAGVFMALFALSWGNYWFSLVVMAGFVFFKVLFDLILVKRHGTSHIRAVYNANKSLVVSLVIVIFVLYLITVPYFGFSFFTGSVSSIFGSFSGSSSVKGEAGLFPNVYVSVAEMQAGGDAKAVAVNAAGLDTAAGVSGLPIALLTLFSPFVLSLACIGYLAYSYYKRREHLDTLLFVGVWFFGFLFASMVAVRATIFLSPVYAICSGIIIAKFWRMTSKTGENLGE